MQISSINELALYDLPLFSELYEVAKEGHKDQKRKTGLPYQVHIDAVIVFTHNNIIAEHNPDLPYPTACIDFILSLAACHDLVEDHGDRYTLDGLKTIAQKHLGHLESSAWHDSLLKPTKPKGGEYADYIVELANDPYAAQIKLADLRHNMSDLPSSDKKSKYLLADAYIRMCVARSDPAEL